MNLLIVAGMIFNLMAAVALTMNLMLMRSMSLRISKLEAQIRANEDITK